MPDALKLLTTKRSFKAVEFGEPGPSAAQSRILLAAQLTKLVIARSPRIKSGGMLRDEAIPLPSPPPSRGLKGEVKERMRRENEFPFRRCAPRNDEDRSRGTQFFPLSP
jgi:hypothetical protein